MSFSNFWFGNIEKTQELSVAQKAKFLSFFTYRSEMKKKCGVTFWKKCIFAKFSMFQSTFQRFFFRGPIYPPWSPFCHGRKKNQAWRKKVTKYFFALLWGLPLINLWVLSPYLHRYILFKNARHLGCGRSSSCGRKWKLYFAKEQYLQCNWKSTS